MKTLKYETQEEWMEGRRGKITGSRLKDIVVKRGIGQKKGYYELIAERLGIAGDGENAMDRGHRLEEEAIAEFSKTTGMEVDTSLVIWTRDDNESIAISPDGFVDVETAVEVKCLSSASHIEALLTQKIPSEYEYQKLQYFIVNDQLQTLYFVFYDPRLLAKPFFFLEVHREEVQEEVEEYLAYQRNMLDDINNIVNELTF